MRMDERSGFDEFIRDSARKLNPQVYAIYIYLCIHEYRLCIWKRGVYNGWYGSGSSAQIAVFLIPPPPIVSEFLVFLLLFILLLLLLPQAIYIILFLL